MQDNYVIDSLKKTDYQSFLQLLEQLTVVGSSEIGYEEFCKRVDSINSHVFVIREIGTCRVVGTGSVLIEKKFIHSLGSVGHIEDIVIDKGFRGKGLGKLIVTHLVQYAKSKGCYKTLLNCSEDKVGFYEKCGFKGRGVEMAQYF